MSGLALDCKLDAYLLDPADARYDLAELLARYAGAEMAGAEPTPSDQLERRWTQRHFPGDRPAGIGGGGAGQADREALEVRGLAALNDDVEVPLVRVLARMEDLGVGVDQDALQGPGRPSGGRGGRGAGGHCCYRRPRVQRQLHPAAPAGALRRVGLTPHQRPRPATQPMPPRWGLRGEHPVVEHLLLYREVEKLRSTYEEGLLSEVAPTVAFRDLPDKWPAPVG
ncbi:MAG: hypothetical protein IPH38_18525 [Candidatus Microthrix sp.]|nr:hypothetical protein [Candidatus Microthrix sp.]MBK7021530.1 hypothetical protein [Candidatus Microthrix sp.]